MTLFQLRVADMVVTGVALLGFAGLALASYFKLENAIGPLFAVALVCSTVSAGLSFWKLIRWWLWP